MTIPSVNDINNQGFYVPYDPNAEGTALAEGQNSGGLRDDFMWGFATASAQIEGGGKEKEKASGRGRTVSGCRKMIRADLHLPYVSRLKADRTDLGHAMRPPRGHQRRIARQ